MARLESVSSSLIRLLCLIVLFFPSLALANAGQLIFARGEVSILGTDGQSRAGRVGAAVNEGDHITTGDNSMVQIRLSDGALVSLRSHSDYQIQVQKEKGLLEQAGKLFSGWMRSVSGAIGQSEPDSVSWSTPVATIGIRGTTFQVIHIPEGGLPGYDDTPPGTYIYLEEGGIESTSEGGTRYIQPGQVVWIPDRNKRPRLAPERRQLFLSGLAQRTGESERRRLRYLRLQRMAEERRDRISDALLSGFLFTPRPAALGIFGNGQFRSISPNIKTLGSGSNTLVTAMRMPGDPDSGGSVPQRDIFVSNSSAIPLDVGGRSLATGTDISWGYWSSGDYTYQEDPLDGSGPITVTTNGDWHYIWTDQALFDVADVLALGLTGRQTYGYIGGTSLTESFGGGTTMDIVDGRLVVDFGSLGVFADLKTFDGSSNFRYVGSGNFAAFYSSGGITLNDQTGNAFGNGYMQGMFAGSNAEAVTTIVDLAGISTGTFTGAAAFRRDGLYSYRNVAATGSFASTTTPELIGAGGTNLRWDRFGDSRTLVGMLDPAGGTQTSDYLLQAADSAVPANTGFHLLADNTEINWGVWDASSYSVTDVTNGTAITPQGDWHYMMANNVILGEQGLLDTGLSGTVTYNYVGGSQLTSPSGANPYTVNSGTIDVIFGGNVTMDVQGISLSGPVGPLNLTTATAVPVSDFFGSGVLLDTGDPNSSASMTGVFAGTSAEGMISTIELSDGAINAYTGTAAFAR